MNWKRLFENPRAQQPSAAEQAARRLHYGATYLLGMQADIVQQNEPTRERWRVTVASKHWQTEIFWVYDDHILGAQRRYTNKRLYRGDAELAQLVNEIDAALESVGPKAPYQVWKVEGGTAKVLVGPAHSLKEAVAKAVRISRYEKRETFIRSTGGSRKVLRRFLPGS